MPEAPGHLPARSVRRSPIVFGPQYKPDVFRLQVALKQMNEEDHSKVRVRLALLMLFRDIQLTLYMPEASGHLPARSVRRSSIVFGT
jgi:hypothetical protein